MPRGNKAGDIRRVTGVDEAFDQVYRLMEAEFDADVIEEKAWYRRLLDDTRRGDCSNPFLLIVLLDSGKGVAGYVAGNYMPLSVAGRPQEGFAAIGHIYVDPGARKGGAGSEMLSRFMSECRAVARERGERFIATLGEVQDGATAFFRRRGFLWPRGVYYAQPPLLFDRRTGRNLYPEVPENLMIRPESRARRIEKALLLDIVRTLFGYWILEKHRVLWGDASRRVLARVESRVVRVYEDFRRSVESLRAGPVPLVDPSPSRLCAQDPSKRISLRPLTAADMDVVAVAIGEIFDPVSAEKALATCHRFVETPEEPLAEETVYLAVDANGDVLGLTGVYIVAFSTGWPALEKGRRVAGRLGWFGLRPRARGGLGGTILRLTEVLAFRRGICTFCIETSSNPMYRRANQLYERHGYGPGVDVPSYFGDGRPIHHWWAEASSLRPPRAPEGLALAPLTEALHASTGSRIAAFFGQDAPDFETCVQGYLRERRTPASQKELWLVRSEFHAVMRGRRSVGALGIARYQWIRNDVFWVRWIAGAPREVSRSALLDLAVGLCLRRRARIVVLELEGPKFEEVARRRGFQNSRTIPSVHLPLDAWRRLLRRQRREGLAGEVEEPTEEIEPLEFRVYSKPLLEE